MTDRRFLSPLVLLGACALTVTVSGLAAAQPPPPKQPAVTPKQPKQPARRAFRVQPAQLLVTLVSAKGEPVTDAQAMSFLKGTPSVVIIQHPRADTRGVSKDYALKRGTEALGINDHGNVVGDYTDTQGVTRAYVLENVKQPETVFDIEIAGASWTRAYAINNNGLIVGTFRDANKVYKGFRVTLEEAKRAAGKPIRLTPENTIDVGGINTQALGVNDMGTVVGGFTERGGVVRGFQQKAGQEPQPLAFQKDRFSSAFDITNDGMILGNYGEVNAQTGYYMRSRTFLLAPDGKQVADIDVGFPVTNSALGINRNMELIGMCGPGGTCGGNVSWYQMVSNPDPTRAGSAAELTPMRALMRMENRVSTAFSKINSAGTFVGTTDSPEGALVGMVGSIR